MPEFTKITSDVVDLQEVSMLCMDWVSGEPRDSRITKFLFACPNTKTAFIPTDMWFTIKPRLSRAKSSDNVSPEFIGLFNAVEKSSTINLQILYEQLNLASGGKVFKETVTTSTTGGLP